MKIISNQQGFIGKIIFIIIFSSLIGSGYIVYKQLPDSVEGDLIYPLKDIKENLILSQYEFDYASRAKVYIDISTIKMNEITKLIEKKADKDKLIDTFNRLNSAQVAAINNITQAQLHAENASLVRNIFKTVVGDQVAQVDKMVYQTDPGNYQLMLDAEDKINTNLDRLGN